MGRIEDSAISLQYKIGLVEGKKDLQYTCKHCGKTGTKHPTRQREHLTACKGYLKSLEASKMPRPGFLSSTTVQNMPSLFQNAHSKELHKLLAMAVYSGNLPFTVYENPYLVKFFQKIGFKPPSETQLREKLLDECFDAEFKRLQTDIIDKSPFLNFVSDESSNINHDRIQNLCLLTPEGQSFLWASESAGARHQTGVNIADWELQKMQEVTSGDTTKINSIANDTCAAMRSSWQKLEEKPQLQHVFFVPCDSHGLQLLIADLLLLSPIQKAWKIATKAVLMFKTADLQLAILREHQRAYYGRQKAIIAPVITRWGSQVSIISFF
jgi:Lon protease-like protein